MENTLNITKKHYVKGFVKQAFQDFKSHWKTYILSMIIIYGVSLISQLFTGDTEIIIEIILQIVGAFLGISFLKMLLNTIDGKKIAVKQLFTGISFKQFIVGLIAPLLGGILVILGLIVFIIPGIIIAIALSLAVYAVIDKDKGIMSSLKYSWAITKGYRFKMFVLFVVSILISLIGVMALGIGLIVAVPVAYLIQARLYRELASQSQSTDIIKHKDEEIKLDEREIEEAKE